MDVENIIKSSQEQATASWINHLNQLRLDELMFKFASQDYNLESALSALHEAKVDISNLINSNRGGLKGLHGFIAERAEVGIGNAQDLLKGLTPSWSWANDNGPVDIIHNGVELQQKFVQTGGHFGLEAIREHLSNYPDFLKNGGKYQIPKDFYMELQKYYKLSEADAAKASKSIYRTWKWVHEFFNENDIKLSDIEKAATDYSGVQSEKINDTLKAEEQNLKKEDQSLRNKAYEKSKPTVKEGAQATVVGAAVEGGMRFCLGIAKKLKEGKKLHDFTVDDWKEIGIDTGKGTATGAVRGASIYAMTNFTATSANVASAFVTATIGMAAQTFKLHKGEISEEEFITNSEVICLDASVSAVAALLGQIAIPIPVLGAIIGNAAGMFVYGIVKDAFDRKEQELISEFTDSIERLNDRLDEAYRKLVLQLIDEFKKYTSVLELAFDENVNIAFENSIELAKLVGVPNEQILYDKKDIDKYFKK